MTAAPHALISGALGFCGRHLAVHLLAAGYRVSGLDNAAAAPPEGVCLHAGDILDPARLGEVLREVRPTHLFHLAALTTPQAGLDALYAVNVRGTGHLLDAVVAAGIDPVVVVAGSSAAYGAVASDELPIGEDQPFRPRTAYAVTKAAQELLAYSYHARHALRVVRARPFNLAGPGESPGFVASAFARQIARLEAGLQEPVVEVGNLESVRDFVDVRDVAHAYRLLGEQGRPGEVYNICSGTGTGIRQMLEILLDLARCRTVEVRPVASRMQPADVPIQVGSPRRIHEATGWRAATPLRETMRDVLDFWRRQTVPGREG